MLNIICSIGLWRRYTSIVRPRPALVIRGILERGDGGVTSLLADQLDRLDLTIAHVSRLPVDPPPFAASGSTNPPG